MIYVMDSGFFTLCRNYYPDIFPSLWERINQASRRDIIISIEQVAIEIKRYGGKQDHLLDWLNNNRKLFASPSDEESSRITEILSVPGFEKLISRKSKYLSRPCADPFVIARAWILNGTVVTGEVPRKGQSATPKIPDVCGHLGIPCIAPADFMRAMGWRF